MTEILVTDPYQMALRLAALEAKVRALEARHEGADDQTTTGDMAAADRAAVQSATDDE